MGNGTFELRHGTTSKINKYNGEETKYRSFAAMFTKNRNSQFRYYETL
jgi:hypothetical protein